MVTPLRQGKESNKQPIGQNNSKLRGVIIQGFLANSYCHFQSAFLGTKIITRNDKREMLRAILTVSTLRIERLKGRKLACYSTVSAAPCEMTKKVDNT